MDGQMGGQMGGQKAKKNIQDRRVITYRKKLQKA